MLARMSAPTPTPPPPAKPPDTRIQVAIIIGVSFLLLLGAFMLLSGFYFEDKRKTAGMLGVQLGDDVVASTRKAYALFTLVVTIVSIAAVYWTRWVAHGLAVAAGLGSLIGSYYSFAADKPGTLTVTLFMVGVLFPLLAWRSFERSRGAWAFLLAMCFVIGNVMTYGAPKLKATIGISLWHAMIIPSLLYVAGIAFAVLRADYRESK
jgi:hypothetical protein